MKSELSPLVASDSTSDDDVLHVISRDHIITSSNTSYWADALDTVQLGVPLFVARLSWVGMKTTDSALLGHVSAEALAAAALSDLYAMSTLVLVQGRILSVFVGQAVGASNPRLAGVYLQVSLLILGMLSLFVILAWEFTAQVWTALGQSPEISEMAGYYARVLSSCIPAQVLFVQLSQFFSAQRIMHPEVSASLFAMILNLVFGLVFVLGIPIPNFRGYGFTACPIVTSVVSYAQVFYFWVVFCWIKRLHSPCWGGWSWNEAVERIPAFSKLYFPAALASASDYWRVAVIGYIAAQLGEREVAIFNTSYRLMWTMLIFVGALSGAAGIKISLRLGNGDADGAKQAGYVAIALCMTFLILFAAVASFMPRAFGRIFTNDKDFLDLWEDCWYPFLATLTLMNLSVAIERIPYSMGRTAAIFRMALIGSWLGKSLMIDWHRGNR